VFIALATLNAWALLVAGAHLLPRLSFRLREGLIGLGVMAVVAIPVWFHHLKASAITGASDSLLQLGAVVLAVVSFIAYFLATYASHVARQTPAAVPGALIPLARLLAAAHAMVVIALLARLYVERNFLHPAGVALYLASAILWVEFLLHAVARLYQPVRLRARETVFGQSVLLPALFGESGPLRSLTAAAEKTFGIRLADTWLVRLAGQLLGPLVLLGVLGVWLSTGATRVPVESRGVLVHRGAFAREALPPGLHLHAPWPWARMVVVPTERVQELSLGFERDLAGPVLWVEKHFEGEQNLLVGQGEELLTINVPLHYRIRDAVTYLRHTGDARAALEALGYRELLAITTTHSAFGLMTTDRAGITEALRRNIQAAADRLQLGLEIVFVGLKDVHPPVAVAPAYQDVVSAEEQRVAFADLARTYAVQATAAAQVSVTQIRLQAKTAATERRFRAQGETFRFLAPLQSYRAQPGVFETRRRLETLEAALGDLRQLILVPPEVRARANFYLGFDPATPLPTPPR
jgi:regulator of protease activity HflC (stomatin/prohibitin superfamily)